MIDPEMIKTEIKTLLEHTGYGEELESIDIHQGATSRFSVRLRDEANILIGEHGNNLADLEYILKLIIRKKYNENFKFALDINEYRMKRLEDLKQDVKAAAKEVRLYKKEVPLRSMSAFERRIVHLLLAEYPDITTESIGQEPSRRVVIKPYP